MVVSPTRPVYGIIDTSLRGQPKKKHHYPAKQQTPHRPHSHTLLCRVVVRYYWRHHRTSRTTKSGYSLVSRWVDWCNCCNTPSKERKNSNKTTRPYEIGKSSVFVWVKKHELDYNKTYYINVHVCSPTRIALLSAWQKHIIYQPPATNKYTEKGDNIGASHGEAWCWCRPYCTLRHYITSLSLSSLLSPPNKNDYMYKQKRFSVFVVGVCVARSDPPVTAIMVIA